MDGVSGRSVAYCICNVWISCPMLGTMVKLKKASSLFVFNAHKTHKQ